MCVPTWLVSSPRLAALRPSQDLPRAVWSFRISVCVLCSSAALSLSISLCKAKRENHWQQRLCCRDVCGCQARGQNLHVNCDKGVGANTEWTDKMLKLVGVKGALRSSKHPRSRGISHDWIARERRKAG